MAKMLGVERMALGLLADRMNKLVANLFTRRCKFFSNKWNPMFLRDWPQRIMSAGAVERSGAIHEHLLNQMLSAPEKNVGNLPVVLDNAAKLLFHAVIAVFKNLLKLVKNNHNILLPFRRDLGGRLQYFIKGRT